MAREVEQKQLLEAISKGNTDVVLKLVTSGAIDLNPNESNEDTHPLYLASRIGDARIVKILLEHGARANVTLASGPTMGRTPLMAAAYSNHVPVIQLLVSHGADVNAQREGEWTALHMAAAQKDSALIVLLLGYNADRSLKTREGDTPESLARALHGDYIADLIRDYSNQPRRPESMMISTNLSPEMKLLNNLFLEAIASGNEGGVKRCLDDGELDLNPTECDARSLPLAVACKRGHLGIVRLLIDYGADVNVPETKGRFKGRSALMTAASGGFVNVMQLLLAKGAVVNAQSETGYTALHYAAANGHVNAISLLIDKGADKDLKASDGETPEQQARSVGKTEAADYVRDYTPSAQPGGDAGFRPRTTTQRLGPGARPLRARTEPPAASLPMSSERSATSAAAAAAAAAAENMVTVRFTTPEGPPSETDTPPDVEIQLRMASADRLLLTQQLLSLQRHHDALRARVAELEASLATAQEQSRAASMAAAVRSVVAPVAGGEQSRPEDRAAVAAAEERSSVAVAERDAAQQQLGRAEGELALLRPALTSLRHDHAALHAHAAQLERSLAAANEEARAAEDQARAQQAEARALAARSEAALATSQRAAEVLQAENDVLRQQLAALQQQLFKTTR